MTITEERSPNSKRGELGQGLYGLDELRLYLSYYGSREDGQHVAYWLGSVLNPVAHQKRLPDYSSAT